MNVVVSNKYQSLLLGLDIDIIKNLNGEFSVDDLVANFTNYYFNKMVIDVTALKDYQQLSTYQQLSLEMDMSKIILLLDDSEALNEPMFISGLISMGIYNFTRNIESVKFLIDNPNSYKDVAQFHQINPVIPTPQATSDSNNKEIVYVDRVVESGTRNTRVIGVKNLTEGAGSTTLAYLMVKALDKHYSVCGLEINTRDFAYFNDKRLDCISDVALQSTISKNSDKDVIVVDLSSSTELEKQCSEVIYLIEPGIVKLNKLIRKNKTVFQKLKNDKIILNKSTLSSHDVNDFEFESGVHITFNIPYLDDRKDNNKIIEDFLVTLGFGRFNGSSGGSSKLFNFFGKKDN
ncbi:MAG: hypothetical protein J5892_02580 [Bacilli bacterium]|nr:hypothetical protein [Bacilli bacterium]